MPLHLVTPPAVEPVSLADVKLHVRMEPGRTLEDGLLGRLAIAGREHVESLTRRVLNTQTLRLLLDGWPVEEPWRLPKPPLQRVRSVRYLDAVGTWQTWPTTAYVVTTFSGPRAGHGEVARAYGVTYPTLRGVPNQVEIEFDAGYGDAPSDVPLSLVQALLLHVGLHYRYRGDPIQGAITAHEQSLAAIERLCAPYRAVDYRVLLG